MASGQSTSGKVYLVGAGPGDPGLITLRGVECLRKADLVLYDYLANPQILAHAPPTAQLVCVGRHGTGRVMTQAEVNQHMIDAAREGRTVVRLKGGDPIVFARIAEEIAALEAAAIPVEVVPGITAALAAGSYAGIPLTHRDFASAVALVTGHEQESKSDGAIDYRGLASFPGTLIFYMGVTTARDWTMRLMEAGKPADTPVVMVRRCSMPDQTVARCTLAALAETIEHNRVRPPVLFVVGEVAGLPAITSWFSDRPLFGRRILVTRPQEQSASMIARLTDLGAACATQPVIQIGPPPDWKQVDRAIDELHKYDWVVFSSANGVTYFLDRVAERGDDLRKLGPVKLAVIGPGTAEQLASYHLNADLQPAEFRAEALAEALLQRSDGSRFLLIRASRGREVLAEQLASQGNEVEQVVAYSSTDVEQADELVAAQVAEGSFDWITVTSSAIAKSLERLFGSALNRCKLASISPITSATLRELGFQPAVEATEYTTDGLVQAILRYEAAPPA